MAVKATVDEQRRTGDIAGVVRKKERRPGGLRFGRRHPCQWGGKPLAEQLGGRRLCASPILAGMPLETGRERDPPAQLDRRRSLRQNLGWRRLPPHLVGPSQRDRMTGEGGHTLGRVALSVFGPCDLASWGPRPRGWRR
jgi:hypothetical protein